MGEVALVLRREGVFARRYALKRLRPALAQDPAARRAFLEEAALSGHLYHPNVVRVYEVGEDGEGPFMLMELVEGLSLAALIRTLDDVGEEVPLPVALELLRDVALGLRAAHEALDHRGRPLQIVHRDLTPSNVLVGLDGVARLADFGIARARGAAMARAHLGGYTAPEVLGGDAGDARADLFAFGVVLYELLVGRRLYRGDDAPVRIAAEPPPDLFEERPDAPPALVRLCFELLAKDPANRPGSAAMLVRRLEAILAEASVDEEPLLARDFLGELMSFGPERTDATVQVPTGPSFD